MSADLQLMLGYSNLPTLIHVAQQNLLMQSTQRVPHMPSTAVLKIDYLLVPDDISDDQKHADIVLDVKEEGAKYGSVLSVVIPRSGPGYLKIYIKFAGKEEAHTARIVCL